MSSKHYDRCLRKVVKRIRADIRHSRFRRRTVRVGVSADTATAHAAGSSALGMKGWLRRIGGGDRIGMPLVLAGPKTTRSTVPVKKRFCPIAGSLNATRTEWPLSFILVDQHDRPLPIRAQNRVRADQFIPILVQNVARPLIELVDFIHRLHPILRNHLRCKVLRRIGCVAIVIDGRNPRAPRPCEATYWK